MRIYGGTGWRLTRSEIWGSRSTSGLQIDDGPRNNLGRWLVKGNCIHDTFPTDELNQDHNVYVGDMSRQPEPARRDRAQHPLQRGERPRHQARAGRHDGGAVNVKVRFNTIYNSSQNVSLSRDTTGVVLERNILVKARESNITASSCTAATTSPAKRRRRGPAFLTRSGTPGSLLDGGGNLRSEHLRFDSIGCSGFHPGRFKAYGARGYG